MAVVVDRVAAACEQEAAKIRAAAGACLAVAADLTQPDQVDRMVATVLEAHGRIDILINNAGGGSSSTGNAGTIEEEDATSWDRLVDANVKTTFLCTRAVAAPMKGQR